MSYHRFPFCKRQQLQNNVQTGCLCLAPLPGQVARRDADDEPALMWQCLTNFKLGFAFRWLDAGTTIRVSVCREFNQKLPAADW